MVLYERVYFFTGRMCEVNTCRYCFKLLADFLVFRPQGRHIAPIMVKFGREERTSALLSAKFHLDRLRGVGLRPQNFENLEFYQYNCP